MDHFNELYESRTVSLDLFDALLGKKIGKGSARSVYEHRLDPDYVVKVELVAGSFQNIIEAKLWAEVEGTPFAKWFAPVVYISACGTVIVQKKVETPRLSEYPEKIPHFFTDRKYQNFGLLKGKLVCFDYGTTILSRGFTNKMQKSKWWSDDNEDVKK